ncbi:futalosine hydrolase [Chitinophaga sp. XS-30]|uniref:futalosine hydrolase n=1 Tax=Chitinophaga sp. XS-30 TaxID=2604421 RepID=UPI0011DCA30E|nr:futalosine hydrolase [Chitinophaga sp. XS-30]QEH43730.1 futalosine hydrolase [Chitinophaga sp. XS-30]
MKVLITAATLPEIKPLVDWLEDQGAMNGTEIKVLITGIGMFSTAYQLGRHLAADRPDLAIQAGIAGAFRRDWAIGDTVLVKQEVLGDLGAEDNGTHRDLFEIGLWPYDMPPFTHHHLINTLDQLPAAALQLPQGSGVTVNTVSGSAATISRLEQKYQPDLESMEGAAFHYCCLREDIPFLQLRTISNYVEVRDKSKWNIPLAINNLNNTLRSLLQEL